MDQIFFVPYVFILHEMDYICKHHTAYLMILFVCRIRGIILNFYVFIYNIIL